MTTVGEVRAILDGAESDIESAISLIARAKELVEGATVRVNIVRQGSVDEMGYTALISMADRLQQAIVDGNKFQNASETYRNTL